MTNADRIRNMTDEELAEFLAELQDNAPNAPCEYYCCFDCDSCWEYWLQSEVEE